MSSSLRRPVYFNEAAKSWVAPAPIFRDRPLAFHRRLPGYQPTRLTPLNSIAKEIGVGAVYVKDESDRLEQPSFKILGASWGTFMAITQKLGLSSESDIEVVKFALSDTPATLFAATDGNHGRAVARMGSVLGIPAHVFVPVALHPSTVAAIKNEGAVVVKVDGTYDETVQEAFKAAEMFDGGILVQDTAFPGYEEIATWIVEGYGTMMREIDDQLAEEPNLVIAPVGVGSFAQAVVSHYRGPGKASAVLTVEPDTAACLWKSLRRGENVSNRTSPTVMTGLNCETVSTIAWPILRSGVNASLTVSDYESHRAVQDLATLGVATGPCGAAPLAALRRLSSADKETLGLSRDSVVVLFSTEGPREYDIPLDVS